MTTVVIVPGSFVPASLYPIFTDALQQVGLESIVIDVPSVGRRQNQSAPTMADDTREVIRVVSPLLDQGKKIILAMQSYGGVPGTQSLEALSKKARSAQGKKGGIEKVVYISSLALPINTSTFDLLQGALPPGISIHDGDDYMTWNKEADDGTVTFSDLPEDEARKWGSRLAKEHSIGSFSEKLTYPGYNDVEVHYILCTEDRLVPPEAQRSMIETIKESSGKDVHVHPVKAGHMPVVSLPLETAKIIEEMAKDI